MVGSSASLVWALQAVPKGNMPWISQAKWYPGPLRPGLGGTGMSHVLCPPSLPMNGGTKVDLEVTALAGSQQDNEEGP